MNKLYSIGSGLVFKTKNINNIEQSPTIKNTQILEIKKYVKPYFANRTNDKITPIVVIAFIKIFHIGFPKEVKAVIMKMVNDALKDKPIPKSPTIIAASSQPEPKNTDVRKSL